MTEHSAMGDKQALPETVPLFPLRNVLLLPHGRLPLNIFEPRYLEMTDDALAMGRLIGMIRPRTDECENTESPHKQPTDELYSIGCVGRIINFMETDDGRYLITLNGISRFRMAEEISSGKPYRIAKVDWRSFAGDLWDAEDLSPSLRQKLLEVLVVYLNEAGLKADWETIEGASSESIINSVAMSCPFGADEKQAILEASSITSRTETLVTLMEIASAEGHADIAESGEKPTRLQ